MIDREDNMNQLAVSLAGHDKGRLYGIAGESGGVVFLADGRLKLLAHPKQKNQKHVRRITNLPKEIEEALQEVKQDSDLVHVLRLYQAIRKEGHEENEEGNEVKRCPSQM